MSITHQGKARGHARRPQLLGGINEFLDAFLPDQPR
jgi:hypothetical protein